jgi:hypothetical protein
MGRTRKPNEERNLPGFNFIINIPIRFQISQKESEKKELDELVKKLSIKENRFIDISELLRREMFKDLKIKNENELLKISPNIRRKAVELKDTILLEMGIFPGQYSKYMKEKIKNVQKEFNLS